ncbi:MAG: HAMP domain-containing protein [Acidobacteria bacterium]|nr:HAMP domain-containing protein [Acidobacteriota bacterium]
MKRRLLYGAGIVLLVLSATLVIWQGSFSFGEFGPVSPEQTFLYWAVSTLVFLLTLTLGFILFRTGLRLYVERRSGAEGSRIRTKLVIGALALSFLPVFFLVLWSVSVLNRNLDKWFSRPAEGVRLNLVEIADLLDREAQTASAEAQRLDLKRREAEIQQYIREYEQLAASRKSVRTFYLLLLLAITLFILFLATWLALFLAKQISNPISALLTAAREVRQGNLGHRVQVRAADELASLVHAFNEMTRDLETSNQELERRRRFTEAILESIPTGVISLTADGRIQRVNHALSRILPAHKVDGAARLEDLFCRDDTAVIKQMMKRARRTRAAMRQLDLTAEHGKLHLAATVSALEDRHTSGFVLVLEDTSELLRAQKAAAWHEVARRLAHEIKNPLTPIALCGERIGRQLERLALPPETDRILRECTGTIASEVESVRVLVNEFSQLAGFPTAQPVPSDLNEIVETALASFAGRWDGIRLDKYLASDLPQVSVDREQFKRVVVNLVDNATEAMQAAPWKRLLVATQLGPAETVELIVADSGCGISPEDRDRLFLPHFSTKGRGTGLGLAIVHHILSEHNASIRVEDNEPCGARFVVEVPTLVAAEAERA